MKLDKLLSIENKKLAIELTHKKIILPTEIQKKIDKFWHRLIKNGSRFTRGEVFTISNIKEDKKNIRIKLDLSDYAHYLYTRKGSLHKKYACKNIHTSCLIETSDGVFVLGRMGKHTSMAGNIQCVGGGLDNEDVRRNEIDLEHNIKKELQEEIGIDAGNKILIDDFKIKYLIYSSKINTIAVIFILKLKITSQKFIGYYENFEKKLKAEGLLTEFDELIYLPRNKSKIEDFYKKEKKSLDHYVKLLLEKVAV